MAESGYDPTTENKTPWEDHGIDHDDGDDAWDNNVDWNTPVDPDRTQPFEPGASSTPYHEGEAHEMANMGEEGEGIPLIPEYEDFVYTEDKETLVNRFKAFIKAKRPKVDFSKIVVSLGKKDDNKGKAVALGPKGGETVIFKQDNTFTSKFSQQYSDALGPSAENIIVEDQMTLRDTKQRVTEAQQLETRLNTQVEKQEQEAQERQRLETQLEQINQRIANMENEGGTEMEKQIETDRLKRESAKLKRASRKQRQQKKSMPKQPKNETKLQKKLLNYSDNMKPKDKRGILSKQTSTRPSPLTSWRRKQKLSNAKSKKTD